MRRDRQEQKVRGERLKPREVRGMRGLLSGSGVSFLITLLFLGSLLTTVTWYITDER